MRDTEAQMIQRIADLEIQNQMLEAFAGAVAHNLKGLLYHIAGYARVLRDVHTALPEAKLHECLELMHNKAHETLEIVDDLLFLSGAELDTENVDAGEGEGVSEPALKGMTLAAAIRGPDRPTEPDWVAAERQASNGKNGARSYRAQDQSTGARAGRNGCDASRNGDRLARDRRA